MSNARSGVELFDIPMACDRASRPAIVPNSDFSQHTCAEFSATKRRKKIERIVRITRSNAAFDRSSSPLLKNLFDHCAYRFTFSHGIEVEARGFFREQFG